MIEIHKFKSNFPSIEGINVNLKKLEINDYPVIQDICVYDGKFAKSDEEAIAIGQKIEADFMDGNCLHFGIQSRQHNKIIGTCGFYRGFDILESSGEVGYILSESFRNQGLMSEALQLLQHFGWYQLNLEKITARVDLSNAPSSKLLKKLHFIEKNIVNDTYVFEKAKPSLLIREIRDSDISELERLFYYSIRRVSSQHYDKAQIDAWAPESRDMAEWKKSFANKSVYVAKLDDQVVGFAELEGNGHIDRFYTSAFHQGIGVGKELLHTIEFKAKKDGLKRLMVEASITARPFFEKFNYKVVKSQVVKLRNVDFINYKMEKLFT